MRFPSSVLLSISYTNSLINLFFMTVIIGLISLAGRYSSPVYFLGLLYFLVASFALIFAITLVMSTLIILVRDFRNVLQNLIRMGFFLTPVFWQDRKSTRLNSSHVSISYAVFCLKKKIK